MLRRSGKGLERLQVKREGMAFVYVESGEVCSPQEALFHYFGLPLHPRRAFGMVFVSPEANDCRRERGPEPGARAVRDDELVGGELRRDVTLCLPGRALGCLPDQAQREPGHCLSRGVAGEAEVAAVGLNR